MSTSRRKWVASLGLAALMVASFPPPSPAGPIAEMLARHRQGRQMKLPPMDKPFSRQPVRDLNVKTASLSEKFKKRFSFRRAPIGGVIPLNPNLGGGGGGSQ